MIQNPVAVCIGRQPESWTIESVPFYCYTADWMPYGREMTEQRVAYLAKRRNKAVEGALKLYPDTEHMMMIDSYYLVQRQRRIRGGRLYDANQLADSRSI